MQHRKLLADRCPRTTNWLFQFDCKYISDIVTAGLDNRRLHAKFSSHTTSKYTQSSIGRPGARFHRNQKQTKMRTSIDHGEARCVVCQSGWRYSLTEHFSGRRQVKHPQAFSREPDQELSRKVVSSKHSM